MTSSCRVAARSCVGLMLLVAAWAGCKSSEGSPALGGETNWLAWCQSDSDCSEGACVCGVCTTSCSAEQSSCAAGPTGSSCFARGSFPYAELCYESSAEGICLPACASDADCEQDQACRVGACSPSERAQGDAAGFASPADEARQSALASFSNDWFETYSLITPAIAEGYPCSPGLACPTLEQLLARDECFLVRKGCGLYYVGTPGALAGTDYWYEGFGTAPVGAFVYSDAGADAGLRTSRSLDCDAIETMCSTCGTREIPCEGVPGAFPEPPPPAPPPGCACEPDGDGSARVSLDCFCGVYDCPASAAAAAASCSELLGNNQRVGIDDCGQSWLSDGYSNTQRFAFDASSALVAAEASTGGPVAAPCNTFHVRAGASFGCATTDSCDCLDIGVEGCASAPWFGSLL